MRIDVHVHHHHADTDVTDRLDRLSRQIATLTQGVTHMANELDTLSQQVEANTSVEASAVTLIQGIAAQLAAAQNDPAKIAALSARLNASAAALAAAIAANTPSAPATP